MGMSVEETPRKNLKSSTLHSMNFHLEINVSSTKIKQKRLKSDLKKCRIVINIVPRLYFGVLK